MRPGYQGDLIPEESDKQTLGDSQQRWLDVRAATVVADTVTAALVGNVTGTVTGSSSLLGSTNLAAATQAVTLAMSGQIFVGAVDAVFTLPAASVGAGVHFHFVTGVASGGTGLRVTAVGSDDIFAAGVDTAGAGSITNSGATDAIGDHVTLVSDGVSRWTGINARGTWA